MANKKISALDLKSTLTGSEELGINDWGTNKKTTAQDIADLASVSAPVDSVNGDTGAVVVDLQSAYDSSYPAEITTNATNGAIDIMQWSGADTDDVFRIKNGSSSTVVSITGEGKVNSSDITVSGDLIELTDLELTNQGTYTRIQSLSWKDLILNSLGNDVAIGKTTATAKLDVQWTVKFNNPFNSEWFRATSDSATTQSANRFTSSSLTTGTNVIFDVDNSWHTGNNILIRELDSGSTATVLNIQNSWSGNSIDTNWVTKSDTFTSGEYDAGTSGTTKTINWDNGATQKVEMTGNCTFTLSNPVVGATYLLKLTQDVTGTRTGTFPATVKTPGGTGITLSTGAGEVDVITLFWDGTDYLTNTGLNYS